MKSRRRAPSKAQNASGSHSRSRHADGSQRSRCTPSLHVQPLPPTSASRSLLAPKGVASGWKAETSAAPARPGSVSQNGLPLVSGWSQPQQGGDAERDACQSGERRHEPSLDSAPLRQVVLSEAAAAERRRPRAIAIGRRGRTADYHEGARRVSPAASPASTARRRTRATWEWCAVCAPTVQLHQLQGMDSPLLAAKAQVGQRLLALSRPLLALICAC